MESNSEYLRMRLILAESAWMNTMYNSPNKTRNRSLEELKELDNIVFEIERLKERRC